MRPDPEHQSGARVGRVEQASADRNAHELHLDHAEEGPGEGLDAFWGSRFPDDAHGKDNDCQGSAFAGYET